MSDVPVEIRKDFDEVVIPLAKKLTAMFPAFKRPTVEQLQELMNTNIEDYEFELDGGSIYTYLVRPFLGLLSSQASEMTVGL